ncbi:unnamed protein product [Lampetra fluviatilis]
MQRLSVPPAGHGPSRRHSRRKALRVHAGTSRRRRSQFAIFITLSPRGIAGTTQINWRRRPPARPRVAQN